MIVHFWCSDCYGLLRFACNVPTNLSKGNRIPERITCFECKKTPLFKWWCAFYFLAYDALHLDSGRISYNIFFKGKQ